jgi:TonB family protein
MNTTSFGGDWVGRVIDGQFPLFQWLGSSRGSGVFVTEFGAARQKAAIKLIPADCDDAEIRGAAWEAARELSHPNLMQVFASGRCELDSKPLLYFVSELADEVLAEILPQRALTPQEAREMLGPVLSALSYLHEKGFVHGHLKPSNIMAVGDRLKLSADELVFEGATPRPSPEPSVYDAPETAQGLIGTAADVWMLGATLVEVLTQRPPAWDGAPVQGPIVPNSVPQPFATVARECLRIDPARRCTIAQIRSRIEPQSTRSVTRETHEEADRKTIARRRLGVSLGAVAVLLVTTAIWAAYEFHHEPSSPATNDQSASAASSASATVPPTAPPSASAETQTEVASASPNPPSPVPAPPASPPVAAPSPVPAPSTSTAPAEASTPAASSPQPPQAVAHSYGGGAVKGEVSHQVQPDVPDSAMRTISGTVKVAVRVSVNAAGNMTNADFDSAGPSKYFANKALEAARQWSFQPAEVGGQAVASTWILHFDFKQSGVAVSAEETTP